MLGGLPYLASFLNREKRFEARLRRGGGCCKDEELGKADVTTEGVGFACPGIAVGVEAWRGGDGRLRSGGALRKGSHCLEKSWSREVREGAEVRLVDSVSCEWREREERSSLSAVMVDRARKRYWGGHRN